MQHDFSIVFDTDNEYWQRVLDIFAANESYPKKNTKGRELHHKFPRSFSKKLGAEGRLKELKREQYLSDAACVIDQYLFEDRKTADIMEGMLHLVFHKNKISCPNRKQNDKGMLSDKFDETYVLTDEDIKSILGRIKMTQDIFNLN